MTSVKITDCDRIIQSTHEMNYFDIIYDLIITFDHV